MAKTNPERSPLYLSTSRTYLREKVNPGSMIIGRNVKTKKAGLEIALTWSFTVQYY
jgi:hypothetical protein